MNYNNDIDDDTDFNLTTANERDDDYDQEGGALYRSFEKDLHSVYQQANEFRQRVENVKQYGGKPPPSGDSLAIIQEIVKILKSTGKYNSQLSHKNFVKIAGSIFREAKEKTGVDKLNDASKSKIVREKALELVKNPDKYFKSFFDQSGNSSNYRRRYNFVAHGGQDEELRDYSQADIWADRPNETEQEKIGYEDDITLNRYGNPEESLRLTDIVEDEAVGGCYDSKMSGGNHYHNTHQIDAQDGGRRHQSNKHIDYYKRKYQLM
jgi:hypothetical protein